MWLCSLDRQHGSGMAKVRHETGVVEVIRDGCHFHGGKFQLTRWDDEPGGTAEGPFGPSWAHRVVRNLGRGDRWFAITRSAYLTTCDAPLGPAAAGGPS